MYKTYRTTKDTIIAEETENAEITFQLITDLDSKEYVMVKRQKKVTIYNLLPLGDVTEIVNDVSFEEYRDMIYARFDKELLEQGIKPRRRENQKILREYGFSQSIF
ncbi:hypothetical protein [Anaerosinus massiliensis]|uniref:hypothetical protein n=1 Tax=Massilibacillus massiliensis TaxID=1806837 RepID=UPI000B2EF072|nr:hypothetical protein [Massilibacillus massiliensis]